MNSSLFKTYFISDNKDNLRRSAENKLNSYCAQKKNNITTYELELHKIELEMQNEELLKAQFELETLKSHYFNLYEQAPIGYITLNIKGEIIQSNSYFAQLLALEKEHIVGRNITDFIYPGDQDVYYFYRKQLNHADQNKHCELKLLHSSGDTILVELKTSIVKDEFHDTRHLLTIVTDLPENRTKSSFKSKQTHYQTLVSCLSKREKEVLNLVLKGFSNKIIAVHLNINYRTVEQHRSRILLKTGLSNFLQFPR